MIVVFGACPDTFAAYQCNTFGMTSSGILEFSNLSDYGRSVVGAMPVNEWIHAVLVFKTAASNNGAIRVDFFVNGVVSSTTGTTGTYTTALTAGGQFGIGGSLCQTMRTHG